MQNKEMHYFKLQNLDEYITISGVSPLFLLQNSKYIFRIATEN